MNIILMSFLIIKLLNLQLHQLIKKLFIIINPSLKSTYVNILPIQLNSLDNHIKFILIILDIINFLI